MATVIGLDDTDSREVGMCTTYVGTRLADDLQAHGFVVDDRYLVRLNPAVPYKTRGNAAVALRTDAPLDEAYTHAKRVVADLSIQSDPATNPGVAVVDGDRIDALEPIAIDAIRRFVDPERVIEVLSGLNARMWTAGTGRGIVGAGAAIGSTVALRDWTVELITYRERDRWGTERSVDAASVFTASETTYPRTWDTIDRDAGTVVCTPHTPGPVLYGLRGDDRDAVKTADALIEHEPVERRSCFLTNQGTDLHIEPADPRGVRDGRAYRVSGRLVDEPSTKPGGHVHLTIMAAGARLPCVAFEPTKRFRRAVRRLIEGDRVTVCGEVADGTLKLEKFALRAPRRYRRSTPTCRRCARRMKSAGTSQGYRCPTCGATTEGRVIEPIARDLEVGWYEVPPVARRHIAKPLVRGGFDGPTHPAR